MKHALSGQEDVWGRTAGFLLASRYGLLLLGCLTAFFSSGSRWDVAIAAWLTPILLLRFARISLPAIAIVGVTVASSLQTCAYFIATAIPLSGMTAALGIVVSTLLVLPLVLHRLIGDRIHAVGRIFLLPVAMVAVEFGVGSILPVGTALGMRAITQGDDLPLLQILSITGPYGIAFLIGCTATVVNRLIEAPSVTALRHYGAPLVAAMLTIVTAGQARLAWTIPTAAAPTVKVAAIIPDRSARLAAASLLTGSSASGATDIAATSGSPQARATYALINSALLDGTRLAARAGARIVTWSETAAPTTEADKPALLAQSAEVARAERIYLIAAIGVPFQRNETYLFGPDGRQLWHYRKNHPVPGLEPVAPFDNPVPVVTTPFGRLASLLCFDGDFPALARVNADILIVPSWDWPDVTFEHSMRMARLRAIENGYVLFRPVFDGTTAAFDAHGRTLLMRNTLPDGTQTVTVDLPMRKATTIYNRIGDTFAWSCVVALVALFATAFRCRAVVRSS